MSDLNPLDQNPLAQKMLNLATALSRAQGEINEAVLDKKNPRFGNRYASLPSVLRAVKPALAKNELSMSTAFLKSERVFRTTITFGPTNESTSVDCPAFDPKDVQAHGSQQTYAMRYNIVALLNVIADEEQDANNVSGVDDDGNAAVDGSKINVSPTPASGESKKTAPPVPSPKKTTVSELIEAKHGNALQNALKKDRERLEAPTPPPDFESRTGGFPARDIKPGPIKVTQASHGGGGVPGTSWDKYPDEFDQSYPSSWDDLGSVDKSGESSGKVPETLLEKLVRLSREKNQSPQEMRVIMHRVTGTAKGAKDLSSHELEKVVDYVEKFVSKKQ